MVDHKHMARVLAYGSVCSGIEAATAAWHPIGWKPAWFSEIEKFPSAVLEHHYPEVPNLGDMTNFKEWENNEIDVLVGGTPCQSFSVAGLRKGLADPRGNLMLTYLAVAAKYRPRWLVWENVPGVLSSNGGRDFGTFLAGLGELGYGFAYRVLDAQYFGVAQRRRRVFVVGYFGDWRRAAAVLFERDSLSGSPAPSRSSRETASGWPAECASTLNAAFGSKQGLENQHINEGAPLFVHGTQDPCVSDKAFALGRNSGQENVLNGIRRLTPRECERLQGFPDDYTAIPWRGKQASDCPDGPRYKALGNSMAVPVMRWIGEMVSIVDSI